MLSVLLLTLCATPASGQAGGAEAQPEFTISEALSAGDIRVRLLYDEQTSGLDLSGVDEVLLFAVEPDSDVPSPVDTLSMSPLEKIFWSRHGLMRVTGLFRLDDDNPTNDLRQIARTRRRMLSLHQALGLGTAAAMVVTVVGGELALDGKPGLHKASLPITIGLYATTATLALASPPKLVPSRGGIDSVTFHKAFAVLHIAGMIVTPMLAPEIGGESWSRRHTHQALGYATLAAFSGGMISVTFFR